jgi:hypothetical protein
MALTLAASRGCIPTEASRRQPEAAGRLAQIDPRQEVVVPDRLIAWRHPDGDGDVGF